jgi:hypothetical protein
MPHCRGTITKTNNATLSEQLQKQIMPHCRNNYKNKQYHTVGTITKTNNATQSEQLQKQIAKS